MCFAVRCVSGGAGRNLEELEAERSGEELGAERSWKLGGAETNWKKLEGAGSGAERSREELEGSES